MPGDDTVGIHTGRYGCRVRGKIGQAWPCGARNDGDGVRTFREREIPCSDEKIPCSRKKIPCSFVLREFGICLQRTEIAARFDTESAENAVFAGNFSKFPVKFPVLR